MVDHFMSDSKHSTKVVQADSSPFKPHGEEVLAYTLVGGFLTIGYFSRTIDCCFPYCFLVIFVGEQGFDGGDKVMMGEIPQSLHWGKLCNVLTGKYW